MTCEKRKKRNGKGERNRKETEKLGSRSLGESDTVTLGFCTILKRKRGKENHLCGDKANQNKRAEKRTPYPFFDNNL